MSLDELAVEFLNQRDVLVPGERSTFGREGDFILDEANPHMPCQVGRFEWIDGMWWLHNVGALCRLTVAGLDGTGYHVLPLTRGPLWFGPCAVSFTVGRAAYELECETSRATAYLDPNSDAADPMTVTLTADQRRLIACLAERHLLDSGLRHRSGWVLPSNEETARRLGCTVTTFNRRLDRLCARLDRHGLGGMRSPGRRAVDRRPRLVEVALLGGLVTVDDL